jgi:Polysaccharide lyase
MKKFLLIKIIIVLATISLFGCGGGNDSSSASPSSASSSTTPASTVNLATPAGTACTSSFSNTDAFGNISFFNVSPINASSWGCLVVDKANSQPVYSGAQSVRFEVRPGDCNSNSGWDDCVNDRSRWELTSKNTPHNSTQARIVTYEYFVYIPTQPLILPSSKSPFNASQTALTQINWQCQSVPCPTLGTDGFGALAFLKVNSSGGLYLETHEGFTWTPKQTILIDPKPQDKWIKLKYVIKSTANADGYIQVYANDNLVVNETRATLPNSSSIEFLRIGIYNAFLSSAALAWQTQVVYFDGISTTVQNF